ncbi:UNVERIFIED_CONTAM: hypothetical protein Sangu_2547500 [Sesamum angustifolium]|uniref:Uncharacterized protein n=1 Tax=Sesamum angustifolium TaxID=2727405 RepID=A0AAW2JBW4_9LAMI
MSTPVRPFDISLAHPLTTAYFSLGFSSQQPHVRQLFDFRICDVDTQISCTWLRLIASGLDRLIEKLLRLEREYDASPTDENLIAMNRCTAQWQQALSIEEDY